MDWTRRLSSDGMDGPSEWMKIHHSQETRRPFIQAHGASILQTEKACPCSRFPAPPWPSNGAVRAAHTNNRTALSARSSPPEAMLAFLISITEVGADRAARVMRHCCHGCPACEMIKVPESCLLSGKRISRPTPLLLWLPMSGVDTGAGLQWRHVASETNRSRDDHRSMSCKHANHGSFSVVPWPRGH